MRRRRTTLRRLKSESFTVIPADTRLYRCLQSGLLPHDSMWMSQKLKFMVKMLTDRAVSDFKLPIEQSLTAMIVPDTLGVLQPDEIYVAPSSATITNPRTLRVSIASLLSLHRSLCTVLRAKSLFIDRHASCRQTCAR